ncbi:MAG: EamA family transporter [Cetobacterium sp.]
MQYILLLLNNILITSGQLMLKKSTMETLNQTLIQKLFNSYFIGGLFLYGISTILWIKILENTSISIAYPIMGLSYVLVMIGAYFIFNEPINISKIIGITFIIIGVVFIAK